MKILAWIIPQQEILFWQFCSPPPYNLLDKSHWKTAVNKRTIFILSRNYIKASSAATGHWLQLKWCSVSCAQFSLCRGLKAEFPSWNTLGFPDLHCVNHYKIIPCRETLVLLKACYCMKCISFLAFTKKFNLRFERAIYSATYFKQRSATVSVRMTRLCSSFK